MQTQTSTVQSPAPQRLLTADEVAAQLGISRSTLFNWRSTGSHPTPRAVKLGSHVRWRQSDIDEFISLMVEAA